MIEASLWNSKSNNRYSEGLELVQTLIKSQESSIVRNYYQNNTILNVDENIMRNSQVNEEKSVSFYKAIMKMIEKHLNDKEHPFHMILQTYLTYFIRKVESDKNLKEENVENLLEDVKDFINVIRNSIYIFYNFSELSFKIKKCFDLMTNLFTFDNLTNFFTSFFFYKFEIYDKLFDLLCIVHAEKEELLQKNLKLLQSWSPSDFGVSDSLTLDIKTYKYFQKNYNYDAYDIDQESLERIKNIFQTKNEDLVSTLNYVFPPKNEKSLNLNSDKTERKASQLRLNKKQPKNKQFQPYANAIKKLKLLSSLKGPLHKLKILNETFENIIESISEFYLGLNKNFNNHIESDDLISIILYIISQSQIPNLFTHLEIIENFITPNYLLNIIGYQFVTLKVCLNYFENIKEIENRKDQKLAVSVLRESILLDIKKEAESHNDKNTMFI